MKLEAGNHDGASNLSEQLYELPVIDATLPDIIMEEDKPSPDDPRSVEEESQAHFKTLEERRQREAEKLKRDEHLVVNKQDTMKELLKRYKEDSGCWTESKLMVSFEDEDASGDGLLRELYSFLGESFIAQNCKGSSQFTFCVTPNLSPEDYSAVGQPITHQFIQCGSFPVRLAKACIHQALFGCVEED